MTTTDFPAVRDAPTVAQPGAAPDPSKPESAIRAAMAASTARMASGGGLESELDYLRMHLDGLELAVRGLEEADGFSPRSLLPIVQSAQDRCAGIIASLGFPSA